MKNIRPQPQTAEDAFGAYVNSCLMAIELTVEGIIINVNENYLRASGYQAEELIGQPYDLLCPAGHRATAAYETMRQAWAGGERHSALCCRRRKDSRLFWLETTYNPIFDENGWPVGTVAVSHDVTSRAEAVNEADTRLEALHRVLLIAEYGLDGRILTANPTYLDTFQYTEAELVGRNRSLLYTQSQVKDPRYRQMWDYVRAGNLFTDQMECRAADGTPIWIEAVYVPIFDAESTLVKIMFFALNVTWRELQNQREAEATQRLALICDHTVNPILVIAPDQTALYINDSFTRTFGYTLDELISGGASLIFGPAERNVVARIKMIMKTAQSLTSDEIAYCKNGQRIWVSCSLTRVADQGGRRLCLVAVFTDITDVKMTELVHNKALEAMAIDRPIPEILSMICREVEHIIPEAVVCVIGLDKKRRLAPLAHVSLPLSCSAAITGLPVGPEATASGRAIALGEPVTVPDFAGDRVLSGAVREAFDSAGFAACWATPIQSSDNEIFGTVTFYYHQPGEPDSFQKRLAGVMVRLCAIALEREKIRQSVRRLSFYDGLTGLPNRNFFLTNAERMLKSAQSNDRNLVVILIGIDRLQFLKESLGHKNSDHIIRRIAHQLQERWAQPPHLLGRISEDDLVLVMAEGDSLAATTAAQEIQEVVSRPLKIDGVTVSPTASLGLCLYPANGADMEALIHSAFLAMNEARSGGGGRFSFFNVEHDQEVKKTLALESGLRRAIGGPEFHLRYQPQINLKTGALHGAEALIRWNSPDFGDVPPERFIPVIERSGLIARLSQWVLAEACRDLRHWRQKGLEVPTLSINLSASNFTAPDFLDTILAVLKKNRLTPRDLILELTEGIFMDPDSRTLATINQACRAGLRFSVDDFGTGYSCLSYLHRLPISELKLDRSFVINFHESDISRRISQAIMGIGQSLDLTLVAEGVETERQLGLLREQGWHAAQGYLFSRPLPGGEFEAWVANHPGEAVRSAFAALSGLGPAPAGGRGLPAPAPPGP